MGNALILFDLLIDQPVKKSASEPEDGSLAAKPAHPNRLCSLPTSWLMTLVKAQWGTAGDIFISSCVCASLPGKMQLRGGGSGVPRHPNGLCACSQKAHCPAPALMSASVSPSPALPRAMTHGDQAKAGWLQETCCGQKSRACQNSCLSGRNPTGHRHLRAKGSQPYCI